MPPPHRSGSTNKPVELAADDRCETGDLAGELGDDHLAVGDLR